MADSQTEIDLDSVIDRLLEGEWLSLRLLGLLGSQILVLESQAGETKGVLGRVVQRGVRCTWCA